MLAYRPGCRSLTTDVCVPLSRLADCIEETVADIEANLPYPAPIVGHVADGNFHCGLLLMPTTPTSAGWRRSSPPAWWRAPWRWAARARASTASASASSAT